MGFPVVYSDILLPKLLLNALSILSFSRNTLLAFLRLLGLSDFLESDIAWPDPIPGVEPSSSSPSSSSAEHPSVAAKLIREMLPVVKFSEMIDECRCCSPGGGSGVELPESCAVCLYEFEGDEEIRRLVNCRHIFHRSCLDRWMDHDQNTCPLCRTPFVPVDMMEEFNQRLWDASGITEFYGELSPITNFL